MLRFIDIRKYEKKNEIYEYAFVLLNYPTRKRIETDKEKKREYIQCYSRDAK